MTPAARIDRGRIRLAGVYLYLERALRPPGPVPPHPVPRAYGTAPVALSTPGDVVAAVADDEAVWLGFQATDPARGCVLRVRLEGTEPVDAATGEAWSSSAEALHVPPVSRLVGLPVPGGVRLFTPPDVFTVVVDRPAAQVTVRLLPPDPYADLTGTSPARLDPAAGYGGWRAP